eukprot:TRINITY_DN172_c0_g1_i1.p1 TRINITY_DN172_c0_g1~~TRINITY_DN172_c0_g1_i1.p1  ORF type:complete len:606 (+),score=130.79 TRINITY_DN172_c0_g1_i1:75-1820(+)
MDARPRPSSSRPGSAGSRGSRGSIPQLDGVLPVTEDFLFDLHQRVQEANQRANEAEDRADRYASLLLQAVPSAEAVMQPPSVVQALADGLREARVLLALDGGELSSQREAESRAVAETKEALLREQVAHLEGQLAEVHDSTQASIRQMRSSLTKAERSREAAEWAVKQSERDREAAVKHIRELEALTRPDAAIEEAKLRHRDTLVRALAAAAGTQMRGVRAALAALRHAAAPLATAGAETAEAAARLTGAVRRSEAAAEERLRAAAALATEMPGARECVVEAERGERAWLVVQMPLFAEEAVRRGRIHEEWRQGLHEPVAPAPAPRPEAASPRSPAGYSAPSVRGIAVGALVRLTGLVAHSAVLNGRVAAVAATAPGGWLLALPAPHDTQVFPTEKLRPVRRAPPPHPSEFCSLVRPTRGHVRHASGAWGLLGHSAAAVAADRRAYVEAMEQAGRGDWRNHEQHAACILLRRFSDGVRRIQEDRAAWLAEHSMRGALVGVEEDGRAALCDDEVDDRPEKAPAVPAAGTASQGARRLRCARRLRGSSGGAPAADRPGRVPKHAADPVTTVPAAEQRPADEAP